MTDEKPITDPANFTFKEGHVYRVFVQLEPLIHPFTSGIKGKINNNDAVVSKTATDSANYIIAYYDFPALIAKPEITSQPKDVSVVAGKTVSFKITAFGTGLSYQWQYSKNSGSTWLTWSGKTSSSVTVNATANNSGWLYRCIVKNAAGSVTSSSAKLTVK